MAEEEEVEVDWGIDEPVDEWRGAGRVGDGDDDDVISLDGIEVDGEGAGGGAGAESHTARRSSSPRKPPTGPSTTNTNGKTLPTGPSVSKNPPTGPRRSTSRPTGHRTTPLGPKRDSSSSLSATKQTGPADAASASAGSETANAERSDNQASFHPAPLRELYTGGASTTTATNGTDNSQATEEARPASPPLPPGWTSVMSKSHKRPFYYHKETNTTVWDRPEATTISGVSEPKSPQLAESGGTVQSAESTKQEDSQVNRGLEPASAPVPPSELDGEKKKIPTGPAAASASAPKTANVDSAAPTAAATDSVATAYAARKGRSGNTAPPSGPSRLDNDRRRQRTPPSSRNGNARDDDYNGSKRFKSDDSGRRANVPPPDNDYRRQRSPPRPIPPQGPRFSVHDRKADAPRRSPPSRSRPLDEPRERGIDGPPRFASNANRGPPPRSPPRGALPAPAQPRVVQGPNSAPLTNNRWGAHGGNASGISTTPVDNSTNRTLGSAQTINSKSTETSAALRERTKEIQEAMKRLKEEEARLLKLEEEEEKKRREDEEKRAEEKREREKEILRKRDDEDRRRWEESRRMIRPQEPHRGDRSPLRDASVPGVLGRGDSYRPVVDGPDNRSGPPPFSSRLDPAPRPRDRDRDVDRGRDWGRDRRPLSPPPPHLRRASPIRRPLSPMRRPLSPIRRPLSPVRRPLSPMRRPLSPPPRDFSPPLRLARRPSPPRGGPGSRPPSPPRRGGGDSYYPSSEVPPQNLSSRLGARIRGGPDQMAIPMSMDRDRRRDSPRDLPPPPRRGDDSRLPPRPLADRMSMDDGDRRWGRR
ncbi:hypothetical protein IAR55_005276 [Kwoniella newhampshirensis]|uniref:WW domain-containing protein n=1 Tax=Kwoniella newhampshirensis TaxID=1651941 RepID=A0AAW0YVD3_9TREE